jgi:hypothetical protein
MALSSFKEHTNLKSILVGFLRPETRLCVPKTASTGPQRESTLDGALETFLPSLDFEAAWIVQTQNDEEG